MKRNPVASLTLLVAVCALVTGYASRVAGPRSTASSAEATVPGAEPFSAFDSRYRTWLQAQSLTNEQLAALPKKESMVDTAREASSLPEAMQLADQIVLGVGQAIKFEPYRAIVTFRVEARFKGEGDSDMTVIQIGGPTPDESFRGASLTIDPADPLLLPGTRAILLLRAYPGRPGAFYTEGMAGNLLSVGGTMKAVPGNPFAADITGRSEGDVGKSLQAAVLSAPPATAPPPPPAPELTTRAKAAIPQLSDFPVGWKTIPDTSGGIGLDTIWGNVGGSSGMIQCLGIDDARRAASGWTSPTFSADVATQARVRVEYLASDPSVKTIDSALRGPNVAKCELEAFKVDAARVAPAGAVLGPMTIDSSPIPLQGPSLFASRIRFDVHLQSGVDVPIYQDLVVASLGRAIIPMIFASPNSEFPVDLMQTLIDKVLARA